MSNNYAKLKNTYSLEPNLRNTPPDWWGIIGSNKKQATLVNPSSPHSMSGNCSDFSHSWTADLNKEQPPIPYFYDKTGNTGTLTCKTTQSGNKRNVIITCHGNECCDGNGLNGLIPAGISFEGMVRPGDLSKPQCVATQTPSQPTSWFCSDPAKRICTQQVTKSGIQKGCAATMGIQSGTGKEIDCRQTCYEPIPQTDNHNNKVCKGWVGWCHDLQPSNDVNKPLYRGQSCSCDATQGGSYSYNGSAGCIGNDGFEKSVHALLKCQTGKGSVTKDGFLGMGGDVGCT